MDNGYRTLRSLTVATMQTKFTADMAKTMTPAQVVAFWKARQIERRDTGQDHYTSLVNAANGQVVTTLE